MTEDQREQWRQALAAKNAQNRRQRYRPRARGVQAVTQPGMVRVPVQARTKPRGKTS